MLCGVLFVVGNACEPAPDTEGEGQTGEGETGEVAPDAGATAEEARGDAAASPGKLAVVVTYEGEAPSEPEPIQVDTDVQFCGGKVYKESLIVHPETSGLKNVAVRLEKVRGPREIPDVVTVTNRNCSFDPHVQVTMKGTELVIENSDPILHTTHPYINDRHWFNVPIRKDEPAHTPRPIRESGIMKIKCDVHKWMEGWIVVHDNPYIALSDEEGGLEIDEIPPATYPYVAWHEKLGELRGEVTIESGKTAELHLEYPAK